MSQTIPPQPIESKHLIAPHRIVRWAIAGLVLAALAAFVSWEVLRVTAPPDLVLASPADNLLTSSHRITLEGTAEKGAAVTANGASVPVSMDGRFKETMDLRTGSNVITIVASKKFAKPNIVYRRVVVTE
jgi:hypothetical protein